MELGDFPRELATAPIGFHPEKTRASICGCIHPSTGNLARDCFHADIDGMFRELKGWVPCYLSSSGGGILTFASSKQQSVTRIAHSEEQTAETRGNSLGAKEMRY